MNDTANLKETKRKGPTFKARSEVAAAYNPNNPYGNWGGTVRKSFLLSYNPDDLVKSKTNGIQIYQEMTREPVVKAALMQKVTSLLSVPWGVKPASADAEHIKQAQFVAWNFKRLSGGFMRDVYEMCDALVVGYSVQEKIYDFVSESMSADFSGMVRLVALKSKDPYYFGFAFDEYMNLLPDGVMMTQGALGQNNVPLPADKFFIFSFLKKYENLYGQSDLRAAYRAFWIKDTAWKLRSVYMERFSGNNLKGKYPRNKNAKENKEALIAIFQAWQNETGVAIPDDLEIEVMQVATSSDSEYARAMADCNVDIAIGILGESLTLNEGRKTGARNMGEIHKEVVDLFIQFLDMILTADINEQIVRPLIDLNYSGTTDYPEFYWYPREDYDPVAFGTAIALWQTAGADISKAWFYEKTRMPIPSGDGDILKPVQPEPPTPPAAEKAEEKEEEPKEEEPAKEDMAEWDESKHPRDPKGEHTGGHFTGKNGGMTFTVKDVWNNEVTVYRNPTEPFEESFMKGVILPDGTLLIWEDKNGLLHHKVFLQELRKAGKITKNDQNNSLAFYTDYGKVWARNTDRDDAKYDENMRILQRKLNADKRLKKLFRVTSIHTESDNMVEQSGYSRPLSKFEKFAEIDKVDLRLKNMEDKAIAASRPAYEAIFANVLKQVESKDILGTKDLVAAAKVVINPAPLKASIFRALLTASMLGRADVVTEIQNQGFDIGRVKRFKEIIFDWSILDEPMTPEEAAKFFSGKVPMTREEFDALVQQLMDESFYVTGLEKLNIERDVKALLTEALKNGMDIKEFKHRLDEMQIKYVTPAYGRVGLIGDAILDYHAVTVFRTNMMDAYNKGRKHMYRDPAVRKYFPALQYTAIMDGRTTEICEGYDDLVFLNEDPIWDKIWPPNHHNCRSTVVTINKYDFKREMLSEYPTINPAPGFFNEQFRKVHESSPAPVVQEPAPPQRLDILLHSEPMKSEPLQINVDLKQEPLQVQVDLKQEPLTIHNEPVQVNVDLKQEPIAVSVDVKQEPIQVQVLNEPVSVNVDLKQEPIQVNIKQEPQEPVQVQMHLEPVEIHQEPIQVTVHQEPLIVTVKNEPVNVNISQDPIIVKQEPLKVNITQDTVRVKVEMNEKPKKSEIELRDANGVLLRKGTLKEE